MVQDWVPKNRSNCSHDNNFSGRLFVVLCRDTGVMDNDGYVAIVGRSKDMLIRGGENIYPTEIENFLFTHPKLESVEVSSTQSRVFLLFTGVQF